MGAMDNIIGTASGLTQKVFDKKIGKWPGGSYAWGKQRIFLEPSQNTNTGDRSNFFLHGGYTPGSAGCIDLVGDMPEFAKWYKNNGKDAVIIVKYPRK